MPAPTQPPQPVPAPGTPLARNAKIEVEEMGVDSVLSQLKGGVVEQFLRTNEPYVAGVGKTLSRLTGDLPRK